MLDSVVPSVLGDDDDRETHEMNNRVHGESSDRATHEALSDYDKPGGAKPRIAGLSAEQRAPLTALFTAWSMAGYVRLIPVLSDLLKEKHGAQPMQGPATAQPVKSARVLHLVVNRKIGGVAA